MDRVMKDSGIEWIGKIPLEWEVKPHKYVMHKIKEICPKYNGENIISLTLNGVIVRDLVNPKGKMPATFDGYQKVYSGNLLLCLFDIDVTPRCVGFIQTDGLTSPAYSQFVLKDDNNAKYFDYLLRMIDDKKAFLHLSKNLRSSLTESDFGCINTVVPPPKVQASIAEFLDEKCKEVDNIVGNTKATIEEYKKYKQSVITEAVTKGIDSSVAMKDSEIEWVGKIAEHWNVSRLKLIANIVRGGSPRPAGDSRYYDGNIPFMKISDITKDDDIYVNSCVASIKEAGLSNTRMVKNGTLLLTNSGATLGIPKITNFETTFNDGIAAFLDVDKNINLLFLYYSLKARTKWFLNVASMGQGQPNLNTDIIGNTVLFYPSYSEQQQIVDYLNQKCTEIDNLIYKKQQIITELESYKKSLIYECVTGKLEV